METHIRLELPATLKRYRPASPDRYPITPGTLVRDLMMQLNIPEYEVNLVFIDGMKGNLDSMLSGGERVGFFPPLGGG
ncbi:MoaD/ThiS family protein [Thermodesulfobacteriota bacterium]